jgi:hypothetical protein
MRILKGWNSRGHRTGPSDDAIQRKRSSIVKGEIAGFPFCRLLIPTVHYHQWILHGLPFFLYSFFLQSPKADSCNLAIYRKLWESVD